LDAELRPRAVLVAVWGLSNALGCGGPAAVSPADAASDALALADGAPSDAASLSTTADATGAQSSAGSGVGTDASPSAAEDATAQSVTAPVSWLRFANWSPDAPGVDFCIASHGTGAFTGPVVAALAAATDAGTDITTSDGGIEQLLAFPLVSAYLPLTPGGYDVRVVVSGATNCNAPIGLDTTNLPVLATNAQTTVALVGEEQPSGGGPGLQLVAFTDDLFASTTGIAMRFINASPALAEGDVGKGAEPKFTPYFIGVPFGHASTAIEAQIGDATPPFVDNNGYAAIGAMSEATVSVYTTGTESTARSPYATSSSWVAAAGAVVTVVVIGGTAAGAPLQLLQCADNAATVGVLGDCTTF
jgi:hypothetical protein